MKSCLSRPPSAVRHLRPCPQPNGQCAALRVEYTHAHPRRTSYGEFLGKRSRLARDDVHLNLGIASQDDAGAALGALEAQVQTLRPQPHIAQIETLHPVW